MIELFLFFAFSGLEMVKNSDNKEPGMGANGIG